MFNMFNMIPSNMVLAALASRLRASNNPPVQPLAERQQATRHSIKIAPVTGRAQVSTCLPRILPTYALISDAIEGIYRTPVQPATKCDTDR